MYRKPALQEGKMEKSGKNLDPEFFRGPAIKLGPLCNLDAGHMIFTLESAFSPYDPDHKFAH